MAQYLYREPDGTYVKGTTLDNTEDPQERVEVFVDVVRTMPKRLNRDAHGYAEAVAAYWRGVADLAAAHLK
jgi:hypothetical protein